MKAALTKVRIEGAIQLNEEEIAVLHHVMSYGLAKTFHSDFSKRFEEESLERVFHALRDATGRIIVQASEAQSTVFKEF